MAHGERTAGALSGATAGAALGPVGAGVGGAVGYAAASLGGLFGHKKKKKPPAPKPWYVQHEVALIVGGVGLLAGVVVVSIIVRSRNG